MVVMNIETNTQKLPYETPAITNLGSVANLTEGNALITKIDAAFPSGTPLGLLTGS
jgi:hypothetical protein